MSPRGLYEIQAGRSISLSDPTATRDRLQCLVMLPNALEGSVALSDVNAPKF